MGLPVAILYGREEVAASVEIVNTLLGKIRANNFNRKDFEDLKTASSRLVKEVEKVLDEEEING